MDSSTYKLYHVHGYDTRKALDDYFSDKPDLAIGDDSLIFPIENLIKTFREATILAAWPTQNVVNDVIHYHEVLRNSGHIKGDVLIDLSIGSLVHHLYSACEFFKHIIVLKVSDRCIMELKKWLDKRTGAFDWGHATKLHLEKEDKRDQLQDKEEKVRSAVQHVVKCDLEKEDMTDPIVLPPADCIISAWLLDEISKDQNDFIRYLRKFSRFLKPGGHFILFGVLDTTYYTVGKDKFHALTYDEDFARKALVGEGFVIDNCVVKKRTNVSDLIDYKAVIFIAAHKEK